MGLIDSILNFAGLLLWLNWRAIGFARRLVPGALSLVSTLKRPETRETKRWFYLVALVALLLIRTLFYWHMGSAVDWAAWLDLGAISLPMRSDYFSRMLFFSLTTFFLTLGIFYSWLLLISVVNRKVAENDSFQRLVRLHLGPLEKVPSLLRFFLPLLVAVLAWVSLRGVLTRMALMPGPIELGHLWQESAVIGLATFLSWKYLITGFLLLYIISSYVYLGNQQFWSFIAETSRNLLAPIRWLPLRIGKLDFAPFLGILIVWGTLSFLGRELTWLYRHLPIKWPFS
jgi:uncharacterized protein YggT (Ycf19 family)